MKSCHFLLALVLIAMPLVSISAGADPVPRLFAYCMEIGVPGLTPRPLAQQAAILHELGYHGIGMPLEVATEANLKMLDETGLPLAMLWSRVNVNPAKGAALPPHVSEILARVKGRPVVLTATLGGLKPGDPQGMEPAVKALRELGDLAAQAGIRVSVYNHVNDWGESIPFIVQVVRKVNHPQVGFNFNLCHWLKVDGQRDYRPLLKENVDKLFMVTINGATVGAATWTNGLIRPLDEGDFDQRQLLATLRAIGYSGPMGLMCYGVPGDIREHMARSMKAWRTLHQPRP